MAENVLVIAPHPDDESIGCGGTLCLHRQRGDTVCVVFLTSGERSSDTEPAETIRAVRETESQRVCEILGVSGTDYLRLPDLGLPANIERAALQLRPVLESRSPGILYLPHPQESHPDHEA